MARTKRKDPDNEIVDLELTDWYRSAAYALVLRSIQVEAINKNRALRFTYFDEGKLKTAVIPGPVELVVRIAYFFKEHTKRSDELKAPRHFVAHPKVTKSKRLARMMNRKLGIKARRRPA